MKKQISMMQENTNYHSSLFTGIFSDSVQAVVMADNGSDDNLMSPHVLRKIVVADPNIVVVGLPTPLEFKIAVNAKLCQEPCIVVCQSVNASVPLNIRDGTSLLLRSITWIVLVNPCDTVLLGRPLLKVLGLL